jgi:hypothetical protein
MFPDNKAPPWLRRAIVADELRALGLPFVADAWWRKPPDAWLTYLERLEAITTASAVIDGIRRRIGAVPRGLRDAVWRCVVAGLGRLPRDRWPTRRPADTDELPALEREHEREPEPEDQPLVIRRRAVGGRHAT